MESNSGFARRGSCRGVICVVGALIAPSLALSNVDLAVSVDASGAYSVLVGNDVWFKSAAFSLTYNGSTHTSTAGGGLILTGNELVNGTDTLGWWAGTQLTWNDGLYITNFKQYDALNAVIFEQLFPLGLNNTNVSGSAPSDDLSAAFPTMTLPPTPQESGLAYVAWANVMCAGHVGQWSAQTSHGAFGREGGVVSMFNASMTAVVMSAASNFMVSSLSFPETLGPGIFGAGLMGTVNHIPPGFTHNTLLVAGQGVSATMYEWGNILLRLGGKARTPSDADIVVSQLGYWTDNGAYYYYQAEKNSTYNATYQQTMLDVKSYWASLGLPLQYAQADSWWYYKIGAPNNETFPFRGGALWLWEPIPQIFPDGLTPWLGLPWALHNRYFAPVNAYSGNFTFITEPGAEVALPLDQTMFEYIFARAQQMGMVVYEQDWLVTVYEGLNVTQQNVSAAHDWLMAMSRAANAMNITIQYCMPLPKHMLHSTLSPPVTNARASGDYRPGSDQWDIGLSSLFYWAIGIAPSKDDFWTTEVQPGNPYSGNPTEPNWQLQAIVVALSTGPNGPSDMIGGTNASLVLSTVRGDGTILQPDRPAFPTDGALADTFYSGSVPDVWSTFTSLGGYRWSYVLAVRLQTTFSVTLQELDAPSSVVFDYFNPAAGPIGFINATYPFNIPTGTAQPDAPTNAHSLRYLIAAPVFPNGWVLYGEAGKIVPVSAQRIASLSVTADGFSVHVLGARGAQNEAGGVTFFVVPPSQSGVSAVTCPPQPVSVLTCGTSSLSGGCSCQ